jgi:hypothetical protein
MQELNRISDIARVHLCSLTDTGSLQLKAGGVERRRDG